MKSKGCKHYIPSKFEVLEGHYTAPREAWRGAPCFNYDVCAKLEAEGLLIKAPTSRLDQKLWRITKKGVLALTEMKGTKSSISSS